MGEHALDVDAIALGKGVGSVSGQFSLVKRILDTQNDDQSADVNAVMVSESMFVSKQISFGVNFGTGKNQARTFDDVLKFADSHTGIFIRAHRIREDSRLMMMAQLQGSRSKFIDDTSDFRGSLSVGANYFLTSNLGIEMMFDAFAYTWRVAPRDVDH